MASKPTDRATTSWLIGIALLLAALASAVMLVVQHLGHLQLPGCQEGSGCAELAATRWGSLLGWPTAYWGTAYLSALLVAWLCVGRRAVVTSWLKWGVGLGVVGSVFFTIVMFVESHFCQYCSIVHGANLAFFVLLARRPSSDDAPLLVPAAAGAVAFVAIAGVLVGLDAGVKRQVAAETEAAFQASVARIVEHVRQTRTPPEPSADEPFAGRYRLGPERAAIRLVIFSDYECGDCQETERQVAEMLRRRDDIAYSHKQFPLCPDCNHRVKGAYHDNACRAALAAEAAGILGGKDGFWRMHHWLFEQEGEFTDEQFVAALPKLGFDDTDAFLETMQGDEALRRVKADINEGIQLGLNWTPMIFVNGVELRGNNAPRAVQRAIAAVDQADPVPMTAAADRPIPATEKLFEEWLATEPIAMPERPGRWTLGPAGDAERAVRVVLTVCHQNPYMPGVSRAVRRWAEDRDDVQVVAWPFPISKQHNPAFEEMKKERYPDAYRMAQWAEAAGQLGGAEAYWAMHDWLIDHQDDFTDQAAREHATVLGLDPAELAARADSAEVRQALDADIAAGVEAELTWSGQVFINGRKLPSWGAPPEELLDRVVDTVREEPVARVDAIAPCGFSNTVSPLIACRN